jgi:hypothetical protein
MLELACRVMTTAFDTLTVWTRLVATYRHQGPSAPTPNAADVVDGKGR